MNGMVIKAAAVLFGTVAYIALGIALATAS